MLAMSLAVAWLSGRELTAVTIVGWAITMRLILLVAGFDAQSFRPAGGFGQLPVLTHDAASDERFCAEMAALS